MTQWSLKVALLCSRKHRNEGTASLSRLARKLVGKMDMEIQDLCLNSATDATCSNIISQQTARFLNVDKNVLNMPVYHMWNIWTSSYHCCFCDGPKAVDENVAGDVHRWAWGKSKQTHLYPLMRFMSSRRCLLSTQVIGLWRPRPTAAFRGFIGISQKCIKKVLSHHSDVRRLQR